MGRLNGEVATVEALSGSPEAPAGFLQTPHRFDAEPTGIAAPPSTRDAATRSAISEVPFDQAWTTELRDAALAAPQQDPVWRHGDFHTGDLLTTEGRLSAVIDFGEFGVGDPALGLIIAFTVLSAGTRATLGVGDNAWTRGRGWAPATGLNAHVHHAAAEPRAAAQTTRQITQALEGEGPHASHRS
ncbi:phosphotransferase [Lentzea sp. NPDC102401]|uniref:phosphotransferase n=1 Tax=Lentzea sp. NPDC102401 TaxID=3364128 RepID=UPI00380558D0